ncbi:GIY-YIG nuclease family protein [Weissella kandleri]|uniref:GIY-YIG nuclease family protein n=1 Tax=Weissella kandleri TaxID=1616 RepID=UPI00387E8C3D
MAKQYYMYVILTADNTFYCGFTDDVARRFATHVAKKGAKYTQVAKHHPLTLLYQEAFADKSTALRAEAAFKKLTRKQKEKYLREHGIKDFTPVGKV